MATIAHEELFRYLFFTCVSKFSSRYAFPSKATSEEDLSLLFVLVNKFEAHIDKQLKTSNDQRWVYMYGFYKLMSLFKLYENSMASSDSVLMEMIETQFCGVFMLLDKNKYVEIVLSQMERKYENISYSQLHKIRMNSSCRYKKNITAKNIHYPMYVLDEVMENVNMWVKNSQ